MPRVRFEVSDNSNFVSTDFKDFWLAPSTPSRIAPWINLWDGYDDVKSLAPAGLHPSSTGIDVLMQQACGFNSSVNAAYRNYQTVNNAKYIPGSVQALTGEYLCKRRYLNCLWLSDGTTEQRYSNATYQAAIDGLYDAQLRAMMRSRPIGENRPATGELHQFVDAFWHEADGYSPDGVDRALYKAAVIHVMTVCINEAQLMGATPYEYGCGGLLLTNGMDVPDGWDWWTSVPAWMIASDMVVGLWDTYFKAKAVTTGGSIGTDGLRYAHEPFRSKVNGHTSRFKSVGIKRFVLAETAFAYDTRANPGVEVATPTMHLEWLKEVIQWLRDEGEGVSFFSKIDGPASKYGSFSRPGREAVLREVGYRAKEFNRPLRRV